MCNAGTVVIDCFVFLVNFQFFLNFEDIQVLYFDINININIYKDINFLIIFRVRLYQMFIGLFTCMLLFENEDWLFLCNIPIVMLSPTIMNTLMYFSC